MKHHPLILVPRIMDSIAGIVGIYLRNLTLAIGEYQSFWEDFPGNREPSEQELQHETEVEQRMIKALAVCLHLLNELLLTKLLIEKYDFSEETAFNYIESAKEIMNNNFPV